MLLSQEYVFKQNFLAKGIRSKTGAAHPPQKFFGVPHPPPPGGTVSVTMMWHERHDVSNHRQLKCLFDSLLRLIHKWNNKTQHYFHFMKEIELWQRTNIGGHSGYGLSQWETFQCNVVSHWLGSYTGWYWCWNSWWRKLQGEGSELSLQSTSKIETIDSTGWVVPFWKLPIETAKKLKREQNGRNFDDGIFTFLDPKCLYLH